MLNRSLAYVLLASFAAVMVVILMLDDPAAQQAQMEQFSATLQEQNRLVLFPELGPSALVTGIEILDEATGAGLLVTRDEQGRWVAPEIAQIQDQVEAGEIDQQVVEEAAAVLLVLIAERELEATPENLLAFGLRPDPVYRVRFQARTVTDQTVEAIFDIGDANPDNMAYYMYVLGETGENERIYLIEKQLMDIVLDMLTRATPDSEASPARESVTPVP